MAKDIDLHMLRTAPGAKKDRVRIYADSSGDLHQKQPDGTVSDLGSGGGGGAPAAHAASHEDGGSDEIDVTGLVGAGGLLRMVSVTLQPADIAALNTVAFEIIPALGGRHYAIPIAGVLHYRAGATPFTGSAGMQFGWGDYAAVSAQAEMYGPETGSSDFLQQATDQYVFTMPYTTDMFKYRYPFGAVEDVPFSLIQRSPGDALAGGNGTLTVRMAYLDIDGAPA